MKICCLVSGILAAAAGWASPYPRIQDLAATDPLYRQHQQDLAAFHKLAARGSAAPQRLSLYAYIVTEADDLIGLSARLGLRPETIASLNGLARASVATGTELLIPTIQGIFLVDPPRNPLERLMLAWRSAELSTAHRLIVHLQGASSPVWVLAGAQLHPVERAYFLRRLFSLPLAEARLTSSFGLRSSPFTGHPQFHGGIDLAAPLGTPVRAAAAGLVSEVGENQVYGVFVALNHPDGYQTLYGHLSSAGVRLDQPVSEGQLIGRVGQTGWTTGAHLHFEVRQDGQRVDPALLTPPPSNAGVEG